MSNSCSSFVSIILQGNLILASKSSKSRLFLVRLSIKWYREKERFHGSHTSAPKEIYSECCHNILKFQFKVVIFQLSNISLLWHTNMATNMSHKKDWPEKLKIPFFAKALLLNKLIHPREQEMCKINGKTFHSIDYIHCWQKFG